MSFAVFLDVDGVLNTRKTVISSPDGHIGVDDARIEILAGAVEKYGGGDIVLTSDWEECQDRRRPRLFILLNDFTCRETRLHNAG